MGGVTSRFGILDGSSFVGAVIRVGGAKHGTSSTRRRDDHGMSEAAKTGESDLTNAATGPQPIYLLIYRAAFQSPPGG
jgi:hypothetical protein